MNAVSRCPRHVRSTPNTTHRDSRHPEAARYQIHRRKRIDRDERSRQGAASASHQKRLLLYAVTRTLMTRLTVLPLAPRRGWESGFTGCHLVGPYHDLLAILPLDGDRLMTDLEAALVHGKVAEDRLSFQS